MKRRSTNRQALHKQDGSGDDDNEINNPTARTKGEGVVSGAKADRVVDSVRGNPKATHETGGRRSTQTRRKAKQEEAAETVSSDPSRQASTSSREEEMVMRPQRPPNATIRMLNDILCGKGIPIQTYPGNRRLHEIVASFREQYEGTPRQKKADIIKVHPREYDPGARTPDRQASYRSS